MNPINDARLVAETLRGMGFEVMLRENLGLRDFKAVMRQFVSRMENEDGSALLYYAGHGVQIEGRNYLLPVDVGIGDEYEVRDESVDLEETLMSRLGKSRKRERIIILDACRDNPFRQVKQASRGVGPRGFAQMGSDEKGTLIVYSTSPGHTAEDGTGRNSIFTQHFAQEIQKEGIEVGQALRSVFNQVNAKTQGRQTPWYNSSLLGDFYFKPPNVKAEEERRRKEIQEKVDVALAQQKRDESSRIASVLAEREKEREKERVERERMYNAQIAEMKAMLERRDRDLQQARIQVASSAKTRDEQVALLAQAEAERQRLERERANPSTAAPPPPSREQEDARRKAEADVTAKKAREQELREQRDRFLKMEAERRSADERAQKEENEREAKVVAESARREAEATRREAESARREAEAAKREAIAKNQRDRERLAQEKQQRLAQEKQRLAQDQQRVAQEQQRVAQEQTKRKAADDERRAEAVRLAKANAEKIRALDEQAASAAQERQVAESAPVLAQAPSREDQLKRVSDRVTKAREEAERATRDADTQERLARIEEQVRKNTQLEMEMLGRRANTPMEIATLALVEPPKMIVPNSNGDFLVRGVRLPANASVRPPAADVPARCAAFVGAWGGGRWNGERTAEVWVESMDSECRARAIYARGGQGLSGELATYVRGEGRARGDTLSLDFGSAQIELSKDGAGMAGRWSSGTGSATARFSKIASVPDRGITEFANETQDFGASPSRVISTSQVSDRAMLPLPTMVPSVDTLTTVQLDAFLKSHPDAVLVDAIVSAQHKTLPGAYWMPELGQVTLGALELDQIAGTMRTATGGDRSRPVIVFERSSVYGWFGYHGVLRLLGMGYSNIYWYRGGIDAWHDAAFPTASARPWAKSS